MLLQPVLFFPLIMIVQTDFSDGNHAGRVRICFQFMPIRPLLENGSGGVNTDCRKDPTRIFCAELQYLLAGLQTHARFNGIGNVSIQKNQITPQEGFYVIGRWVN